MKRGPADRLACLGPRDVFGVALSVRRADLFRDTLVAGGCAALFSGIPSTLYAWLTGGEPMEATRAAGAMMIPATSTDTELFVAAALVHAAVSLFWALILVIVLPRKHTLAWAIAALACIAVLDLRVIGRLFPEIFALSFWPQFADHIAFGAILGGVLVYRRQRKVVELR